MNLDRLHDLRLFDLDVALSGDHCLRDRDSNRRSRQCKLVQVVLPVGQLADLDTAVVEVVDRVPGRRHDHRHQGHTDGHEGAEPLADGQ
jgi:hypothetical protein